MNQQGKSLIKEYNNNFFTLKKDKPSYLTKGIHSYNGVTLPINSSPSAHGDKGQSVKRMLDTILRSTIKQMAINKELVVVRLNLYPGNTCFDISDFMDDLKDSIYRKYYGVTTNKPSPYNPVEFIRVTEKNSEVMVNAYHHHLLIYLPKTRDYSTSGMAQAIKTMADNKIKKRLWDKITGCYVNQCTYRQPEQDSAHLYSYFGWDWKETPFASCSGFFLLESDKMDFESYHQQQEALQRCLDNNTGSYYIDTRKLQERKQYAGKAIGNLFVEFFYAASYMAKVASKYKPVNAGNTFKFMHSSRNTTPFVFNELEVKREEVRILNEIRDYPLRAFNSTNGEVV